MSDSDSDYLAPTKLPCRNDSTMIHAKGPHFSNIMNLNFNSTHTNLPRNAEMFRFGEYNNMRNGYNRRETSPMSIHSASDMQPRNFHQSYHPGVFPQSSMMSQRGGSPVSVRSINSNMSVTADSIVSAMNNTRFNKYELRSIKEAYNRLMRGRARRRIAKRRNLKLYVKGVKRKSGDDSGEQGSDSSISSDDCRSTRTGMTMNRGHNHYKSFKYSRGRDFDTQSTRDYSEAKISRSDFDTRSVRGDFTNNRVGQCDFDTRSVRGDYAYPRIPRDDFDTRSLRGDFMDNQTRIDFDARSAKTDLIENRRPRDDFLDHRPTKSNLMDLNKTNLNQTEQSDQFVFKNPFPLAPRKADFSFAVPQNRTFAAQRNRFLLPYSQRVNTSVTSTTLNKTNVLEKSTTSNGIKFPGFKHISHTSSIQKQVITESDEDSEVLDATVLERTEKPQKRSINCIDEPSASARKRAKMSEDKPLGKPPDKTKKPKVTSNSNKKDGGDFVFPAPKPSLGKQKNPKQDKAVANQEIECMEEEIINNNKPAKKHTDVLAVSVPKETESKNDVSEMSQINSDLSMRPSFIKRKLFTQTMDITENRNTSNESPSCSPKKRQSEDKHKARKLVTSSSCLTRDILNDDNNLTDLINKLVPQNGINSTLKSTINTKKSLPANNENPKAACKDTQLMSPPHSPDKMSESYTDDEIFNPLFTVRKKHNPNKTVVTTKCTVVIDKLNITEVNTSNTFKSRATFSIEKAAVKKPESNRRLASLAHEFWNCDSETEGPSDTSKPANEPTAPKNRPEVNKNTSLQNKIDSNDKNHCNQINGKLNISLRRNAKSVKNVPADVENTAPAKATKKPKANCRDEGSSKVSRQKDTKNNADAELVPSKKKLTEVKTGKQNVKSSTATKPKVTAPEKQLVTPEKVNSKSNKEVKVPAKKTENSADKRTTATKQKKSDKENVSELKRSTRMNKSNLSTSLDFNITRPSRGRRPKFLTTPDSVGKNVFFPKKTDAKNKILKENVQKGSKDNRTVKRGEVNKALNRSIVTRSLSNSLESSHEHNTRYKKHSTSILSNDIATLARGKCA